ncbi:MAG: YceI family protein [Chthoniobacterales bacterium]|nr:YceI family protein [Chthoniobacterales bacterium]
MKTIKFSSALVLTLCLVVNCFGEKLTFNFEDPKGVNNILFVLDAPLEQITGSASGIRGTVTGDPENPADISGKIIVETRSLQVPNPKMREHLLGEDWLDAEKNPEISFEVKSVSNIKREGNKGTADVTGIFTLNGVSKEITVPVQAHYLPGRLKERGGNQEGDILVLRSNFILRRSDFNIQPGKHLDKVADEIQIKMSIAGFCVR